MTRTNRWAAFTDDELETLADRFVNETSCYSIYPPEDLHEWEKSLLDEIEGEQNRRKREARKSLQRAGVLPS